MPEVVSLGEYEFYWLGLAMLTVVAVVAGLVKYFAGK